MSKIIVIYKLKIINFIDKYKFKNQFIQFN